ncbi:protoporphyrinogen oxidase [Planococcus lenghuensis]|uniref:protoporphyrinogen oxidase n=1 Tax=Planococcus lenghuensis TaxID=2213202 RepID=UPI002FC3DB92
MTETMRKVTVIGGGITGLSTAFYLQKEARERGISLELTLIEAAHRLGGKIQTIKRDGFIIERGPDAFLARKDSMRTLVKELGLESELIRSSAGQTFVLAGEELHPVPGGSAYRGISLRF